MNIVRMDEKIKRYEDPDYWELPPLPNDITINHDWEPASFDPNIWLKWVGESSIKIAMKVKSAPGCRAPVIVDGLSKKANGARRRMIPKWVYSEDRAWSLYVTMVNIMYIDAFMDGGYLNGYVRELYPGFDEVNNKTRCEMAACAYSIWGSEENKSHDKLGKKNEIEHENGFQLSEPMINHFIDDYLKWG